MDEQLKNNLSDYLASAFQKMHEECWEEFTKDEKDIDKVLSALLETHMTPEGQKYPSFTRVRVADDLGPYMSHFRKGEEATVYATYKQQYGGGNIHEYDLVFDDGTRCSWYHEWQLSPVTSSDSLSKEIEVIEAMLKPLDERLRVLKDRFYDQMSIEWIEANGVKKADVEMSSGEEKPWFGTVDEFAVWLGANSSKPWAEWNGWIYKTEDVINGRVPGIQGMDGQIERLK